MLLLTKGINFVNNISVTSYDFIYTLNIFYYKQGFPMKLLTKLKLHLIFIMILTTCISAQKQTITRGNYTLNFESKTAAYDSVLYNRLIETFFEVYPILADRFNPQTEDTVTFIVDPNFDGVAATGNAVTIFNARWFEKFPGDIDVVTHEVMHIIQAYPHEAGPWWVTEGIADYVRNKYGVDNEGAKWSMPEVKQEHSYDNSYRITARFFTWLENNIDSTIISKLDGIMRRGEYNDEVWEKLTGKSVSRLWEDYKKNPQL